MYVDLKLIQFLPFQSCEIKKKNSKYIKQRMLAYVHKYLFNQQEAI